MNGREQVSSLTRSPGRREWQPVAPPSRSPSLREGGATRCMNHQLGESSVNMRRAEGWKEKEEKEEWIK
ncbi:hypothetical protein E2C01_095845 [Portunus trituberculatus]|uniref:Uncharacterized protein n=1 Tax=Portunus trituberculatus TaxID=210409 RepID=A0A5B7K537_PORTR|nr:hypothetical protein [Portunus trituberculatus]